MNTSVAQPHAASIRHLARDCTVSNNTRMTGLNNNDLVVGPSGAGKTGGYVVPNLEALTDSMILTDTKGNLARKYGPVLRERGFEVHVLDLVHPEDSAAYNPLDYVHVDKYGVPNALDVNTLARSIVPKWGMKDMFWEDSTCDLVSFAIGAAIELNTQQIPTMENVSKILLAVAEPNFPEQLDLWLAAFPDGFISRNYASVVTGLGAEKMWGAIRKMAGQAIGPFVQKERSRIFGQRSSFRIEDIGLRPTVVFLNISDTDRTSDYVANLFYTQALHMLCTIADAQPDSRLPVPVRLVLDDFASSAKIPDFDRIISVIRSREISVSVIVQSLSQLESLYSVAHSQTIVNNCDHILYLGGHDLRTADYVAHRVGKSPETVMSMPRTKAYLLTSGQRGQLVDKINPYSMNMGLEKGPEPGRSPREEPDDNNVREIA